MLRGFYTAASGILTQQRTLDVLTNKSPMCARRASGRPGW